MFVSADFLAINYGVHDQIARFFADREPPANNLYWHEKLMYLRPTPGYLFIPTMVDIFHRIGISRQAVLSDDYLNVMEAIGHISAKQESNQITHAEAVEECIKLVKDNHVNERYYQALVNYMRGSNNNFIASMITPFKALHRGDVFLFSACVLDFDDEQANKIIEYWFALISSFLLLDDADDLEVDKQSGDENAFLESGLDKEGIERIKQMLSDNLNTLKQINPSLAITIDKQFVKMAELPHFKNYLN
jgi:hypothetical protein